LATRLAANENTGFFLGLVKPQPGDISIVDKPGTLLMWYDMDEYMLLPNSVAAVILAGRRLGSPPERDNSAPNPQKEKRT
jgi:hypothetical protein